MVTMLQRLLRADGHREPDNCPVAAMSCGDRAGLQFHPGHPLAAGNMIIRNFIFDICGASPDWTMGSFIEDQIRHIRETVGTDHVICGMSGGVDWR